jgi:hypothetical protein
MQKRRWPKIVFGAISGIVAVGVTAGLAIPTGGIGIALAAPGVVSGAYAAVEAVPKRDLRRSPMAYAALAEKHFS